jgi:hypothetical protein
MLLKRAMKLIAWTLMMLSVASCAQKAGIAETREQTCTIWLPIYVSPADTIKTQTQVVQNNLARSALCQR